MTGLETIPQIVERQFKAALANPSIGRWKSCSLMAGCAAVRLASDGDHYMAACLEGVAEEARRQALAIMHNLDNNARF